MSENIRKKTCRMLKTVMGITMSASVICSSLVCAFAQTEYPYSSKYPIGIEDADISFFTEREIEYPLNMTFETNEEIEFVKANSQVGQISLSEDAYAGKFAIDIKPSGGDNLIIKETQYFSIGKKPVSPVLYAVRPTEDKNKIDVSSSDKVISVTGITTPGRFVSIITLDTSGNIVYLDQVSADESGFFTFNFALDSYDTYTLRIGNVAQEVFQQDVTLKPESIIDETIQVPETVETKTNLVKLWIKPKYKAESISFHVTALVDGVEKEITVLGDKDSDGIFKVSEDLALGKWQQITLDLLKLAEIPDSAKVKNFYVSANEGSEWVIDSVTSSYREISSEFVDLEQFATDNIICNENGELTFLKDTDDTFVNSSKIITGSVDVNESISGIEVDSEFLKLSEADLTNGITTKVTSYPIPTESSTVFSGDNKKLFFKNKNDNNYIYCMDTSTFGITKVLEESYNLRDASYTGNKIKTTNCIYDIETGEYIPFEYDYDNYYLSPSGDVFVFEQTYQNSSYSKVYKYCDGVYTQIYNKYWSVSPYSYTCGMLFSNHSDVFAIVEQDSWQIYKNSENGCEYVDAFNCGRDRGRMSGFISNDGTKIYSYDSYYGDRYVYDIVTGRSTKISDDYVLQADDGRYLIEHTSGSKTLYYLYDETTGGKENIYHGALGSHYCSERNVFLSVSKYELQILDNNMNTEYNKYLLSFDGRKTWYTYDGGKWMVASLTPVPNFEEIQKKGMTKEEINSIPEEAYGKFYENGNEVYTLNFAIGMFGSTKYVTPVVKSITLNTVANQPVDYIYSAKLFTFDKSNYNKLNSIFPVEDFPKVSECYYLLYLGNEWLYTYKDGKVIRVDLTAEDVAQNTEENWLNVKQSGLTVSEVRNIPQTILTELFLNEKFANTKFGVTAISKVKDDTTATYDIDVKLIADVKYITEDDYYLEISLNGAEKITYSPDRITKTQIDNFLSWLDERQNGNGDIFYRIETEDGQKFINYFNITNVNVYKNSDDLQE